MGLSDTIMTLKSANIQYPGAGENEAEATAPSVLTLPSGQRVIVVAFGDDSSGIYPEWKATNERPGVNYIKLRGEASVKQVLSQVNQVWKQGDIVVATIHQGGNWGYHISASFQQFARDLIDYAKVLSKSVLLMDHHSLLGTHSRLTSFIAILHTIQKAYLFIMVSSSFGDVATISLTTKASQVTSVLIPHYCR